ncbi:MAG TPA: YegS/Rv2252/BmrU family lipid kinase [Bacteroidota bacterium]|nr:YegS/Rv2252/BmrU family lipid kinase [Bacteroidota bacterium]
MTVPNTHIVLNPFSSGGKTAARQTDILHLMRNQLGQAPTVHVTSKPLEATEVTRRVVKEGAGLVIAVGGDGTVHEVVNGFAEKGRMINPDCRLGIVGSGTAQDSIRSFGLPRSMADQIRVACGESCKPVDVGKVRVTDPDGSTREHLFLNECQQGIAAVVVQRFQSHHKWLGGFLGFGLTAVSTAARHREQRITVVVDGDHKVTEYLLGVVISNGGFAGGGMNFAPGAIVDDGLFDVVLIHKQNIPSRLVNFPRIYFGTHINLSWIRHFHGKHVEISSDENVPVESDGEFLGNAPCVVDMLPRSIRLNSPC